MSTQTKAVDEWKAVADALRVQLQKQLTSKAKLDQPVFVAEGAQGQIFKVTNRANSTTLIVKRFPKDVGEKGEEAKTAWKRETSILSHLKAQGFCQLQKHYAPCFEGAFEDDKAYYLSMEYLGSSYMDMIDWLDKQEAELQEFQAKLGGTRGSEGAQLQAQQDRLRLRVLCNLLNSTLQLHAVKVAHRDIKPDNLMIDQKTLSIIFIDFGLACLDGECQAGLMGSAEYVAPEVLPQDDEKQRPQDVASWQAVDLWAVGIVILILLTNQSYVPYLVDRDPKNFPTVYAVLQSIVTSSADQWARSLADFLRSTRPDLLQRANDDPYTIVLDEVQRRLLSKTPTNRCVSDKLRQLCGLTPSEADTCTSLVYFVI